jgi:HEAT repeat protein
MRRCHWIVICLTYGVLTSTSAAQRVQDIRTLFAQLNQSSSTDRAARHILQAASKDSSAREYVVQKLPEMIDKLETDKVWLNAVRLAGQLKALEAIPSLQQAMSRGPLGGASYTTLGMQMRLEDDIVAKALSQIGDPAIPAIASLLGNGDEATRMRVVLILSTIGSPAARKVLRDWLPHETDPRIKDLIESGLRS